MRSHLLPRNGSILIKLFALCCVAFCFTKGYAQSPLTTLKCTSAQGSKLSVPVYSFDLFAADNYNGSPGVYLATDLFAYPTLTSSTAPAMYPTCLLGDDTSSASLSQVMISAVEANASGSNTNTTIVLNAASVTVKNPPSLDGQAPIGTFSCDLGGGSSFLAPVLSYELTPFTNGTGTINMDTTYFPTLLSALSQGTSNCTLSVGAATVSIQYFYIDDVDINGSGPGVSTPKPQVSAFIDWDQGFDDTTTGVADYSGMAPVASLTCTKPDNSTLTAPVYYFSLGQYVTVYADFASFAALSAAANAGSAYASCVLDDGVAPITLSEARPDLALVTGYGGSGSSLPRLYAGTSLSYESMTVGEVTAASTRLGQKANSSGDPGRVTRGRLAANLQ